MCRTTLQTTVGGHSELAVQRWRWVQKPSKIREQCGMTNTRWQWIRKPPNNWRPQYASLCGIGIQKNESWGLVDIDINFTGGDNMSNVQHTF